ncbi:MAG TPA: hypothetical protein VLT90_00145 [Terriglobales bacterium]|nr:hypothetical protein [Terriglobales bacterium]
MKKMLFVLCLVLTLTLGAIAKDTIYTFNFRSAAGSSYCDGMSLRLYTPGAGIPKALVGGTHFYFDCTNNSSVGGFKHGIGAAFQYAASGAVLDVADPAYALGGIYAPQNRSEQYLINTKYHTWVLYSGNDYFGNYVVNYGTYVAASESMGKNGATKSSSQP